MLQIIRTIVHVISTGYKSKVSRTARQQEWEQQIEATKESNQGDKRIVFNFFNR